MKKILYKTTTILLLLASITACHTQRHFTTEKAEYNYKASTKVHKGTSHFFIAGLGQTDKIDAISICGKEENILAVESQQTFINGLIRLVTFSIYSPREYIVYCK